MSINLTPSPIKDSQFIRSYGSGSFHISDTQYSSSVIVFPQRTIKWKVVSHDLISMNSLAPVIEGDEKIDILLIGCGKKFTNIPKKLNIALKKYSIFLEWMDTGAACRTFNLLVTEERQIAAALIVI